MRWASGLLAVVAVCAGLVLAAAPATAQGGERIRGYDVDVRVEASGVLLVTERIDYDFAAANRHGIVRTIPVRSRYDDSRDRVNRITVLSVRHHPGAECQNHQRQRPCAVRVGRDGAIVLVAFQGVVGGAPDEYPQAAELSIRSSA